MDKTEIQKHIKEQLKMCIQDYEYAIKNHVYISHPKRGKIKFNLYPFQVQTLRQFRENRLNIILKSRQMGISTLCATYALLNMIFNDEYSVLVIATTQNVAQNLVTKVKLAYNNLPIWLRSLVNKVDDNKLSLSFDNGSRIKAVSASKTAGRSEASSLLIIDEAAFIDKIDDIWASSQLTLATGGDAIVLSTPNGMGGKFYELWTQATEGESPAEDIEPLNPIKLKWDLHPERDQSWRDQQEHLLGPRMAAQECDCSFVSSGHTYIDSEILKFYKDNYVEDPKEKRGISGEYWIWNYPDYKKSYIIPADVARGDGSDYSTFHAFDLSPNNKKYGLEQVAEYKSKIGTREFARQLVQAGYEWNTALIVVDNKNIGWDVVNEIISLNYPNLFYSSTNDPYFDPSKHLVKGYDTKKKSSKKPGITTTPSNRPVMLSKLNTMMRNDEILLKSKRLNNELFTFMWLNQKPQAREGFNDDLVMAAAYGVYIKDTAYRMSEMAENLTRASLRNYKKVAYKTDSKNKSKYTMKGPQNEDIDYSWLLR